MCSILLRIGIFSVWRVAMYISCLYIVPFILLYADVQIALAQTTIQAETDPPSTTATSCEIGANDCGTVSQDANTVVPHSSTVQPVLSSSPPPSEKGPSTLSKIPDKVNSSSKPSSSTAKPPTLQKAFDVHLPFNDGSCSCDLMEHLCDINCCCDPDCSAFDRHSFSKCDIQKVPSYKNRFCHSTKLVFFNNSEHFIQQSENGMFCIVHSNVAGSIVYPHPSSILSQRDFLRRWKLSHSPSWPITPSLEPTDFKIDENYVHGSPLLVYYDRRVQTYDLPASGLTPVCSFQKKIQFLQPWSTYCVRKAPQTENQCENVGVSNFKHLFDVVKSPILLNLTTLLSVKSPGCPLDVCAQVDTYVCSLPNTSSHSSGFCTEISNTALQNMSYVKSELCHGVVKNLRLVFFHNGTEGIKQISAYFMLSNISMKGDSHSFRQEISVEFNWALKKNSSDDNIRQSNVTTQPWQVPHVRSGNPGYIVGKPIPTGYRIKKNVEVNGSRDSKVENSEIVKKDRGIKLKDDPHQWLTLPGSDRNALCDSSGFRRTVVLFGMDLHQSCGVIITQKNLSSEVACKMLREKMMNVLLGDAASVLNTSQSTEWSRVVAAFGNANTSNLEEWVPLLLDSPLFAVERTSSSIGDSAKHDLVCLDVPLGVHLYVMYGLVGAVSNPQAKIFGALLRIDPVRDISWDCSLPLCVERENFRELYVSSSVIFVDVSSPAVTKFAEPPAIHIRIPPDFFYPFLSSGSNSKFLTDFLLYKLIISFGIYIFKYQSMHPPSM